MNKQDLKHKRKIKQTLDQIDFRGIDPFFLVRSEKLRDLKRSKRKIKKYLRMQVRLDLKSMVPGNGARKAC